MTSMASKGAGYLPLVLDKTPSRAFLKTTDFMGVFSRIEPIGPPMPPSFGSLAIRFPDFRADKFALDQRRTDSSKFSFGKQASIRPALYARSPDKFLPVKIISSAV